MAEAMRRLRQTRERTVRLTLEILRLLEENQRLMEALLPGHPKKSKPIDFASFRSGRLRRLLRSELN